ncbi:MAG: guanylate kinase [Bacteroidales bacterium]|nr:guanylate kinase [Bacteroidales bacterium]
MTTKNRQERPARPQRKILIFSSPSGAGKTTIVRHLLRTFPNLAFSVSATTRPRRDHEEDGKDYYFLSVDEFRNKIEEDAFVEWEEVYKGTYYGTLKSEVQRLLNRGYHVVFDVDVKGALSIKKLYGKQALAVFVMPPSVEELKKRLHHRSTDPEESIRERVNKARQEMKFSDKFDVILINDKLEESLPKAEEIVKRFIIED